MVTSLPRSANVDANSQPMAPPPMTATRAGTVVRSSTSSLVMIGPPRSKFGIRRGTEPEASMTASPVIVADEPSPIETCTVRLAPSSPTPLNTSTLRPLHIAAMPLTSPSTMPCLRACVRAKSTLAAPPASMPKSLEWSTWRLTAAVSRNAFAGMHPRLRQVPPRASFSTRATLRPAEAP